MTRAAETMTIEAEFVVETSSAWVLKVDGAGTVIVPKSQVVEVASDDLSEVEPGEGCSVTIPLWLAEDRGLTAVGGVVARRAPPKSRRCVMSVDGYETRERRGELHLVMQLSVSLADAGVLGPGSHPAAAFARSLSVGTKVELTIQVGEDEN